MGFTWLMVRKGNLEKNIMLNISTCRNLVVAYFFLICGWDAKEWFDTNLSICRCIPYLLKMSFQNGGWQWDWRNSDVWKWPANRAVCPAARISPSPVRRIFRLQGSRVPNLHNVYRIFPRDILIINVCLNLNSQASYKRSARTFAVVLKQNSNTRKSVIAWFLAVVDSLNRVSENLSVCNIYVLFWFPMMSVKF
jgi:hypothetical protein